MVSYHCFCVCLLTVMTCAHALFLPLLPTHIYSPVKWRRSKSYLQMFHLPAMPLMVDEKALAES